MDEWRLAAEHEWRLAAVDFEVLWRAYGRDRLPYPMQCRGEAETEAAHRRARRDAARRLRGMLDDGMHGALTLLLTPEVRVEVCGFGGDRFGSVTRLHAGIRGAGAVLVAQPGGDLDHGGDVRVTVLAARRVAAAVVAALPAVARGTGPGAAVRPEAVRSLLRPAGAPAECARPRTGVGEIGVHPGPAVDWRPTGDGSVVHWTDGADGRYLVCDGAAVPVSAREFAAALASRIARIG